MRVGVVRTGVARDIAGIKRNPCPALRFEFGVAVVGRGDSDWIPGVVPLYDCDYGSGGGRRA